MNGIELEAFVTSFMNLYRSAEKAFNEATEVEQILNDATQDILHSIEFCPNQIDADEMVHKLHEIRMDRREAKQELEVATQFWDWAQKNRTAMTSLEQNLGAIRKIVRRQPNGIYRYKTNYVKPKDSWITREKEPEYEQLCFW